MLRQQTRPTVDEPSEPITPGRQPEPAFDAVRSRNYDHHEGHSVHVTLTGDDGGNGLTDRTYLAPGQSTSVPGPVEPGRYQLRVRVDGVERHRGSYQIDETPAGTVVIELGNGVVSVTEGV